MKTRIVQLGVAGVLILVLGAAAWIAVSQLGGNNPATTAEISASAEQNKQALLEGIRQGRPLYFKTERYKKDPVVFGEGGSHPQTTIVEEWMVADEQGQRVAMVSTLRDLEGNLLGYTELHDDGTVTYTDLVAGMILPLPPEFLSDIEGSLSPFWDAMLSLQDSGWEFKGRGMLNGRTSLIYERYSTDAGVTHRMEVVENAPLLFSESRYEDGVLEEQSTRVEYRFLPLGSALPNPATQG